MDRSMISRFRRAVFLLLAGAGLLSSGAEKTAQDYARDLESPNQDAKREAAFQLSRMGRSARGALPQLIRALDDDQQQVWFGAVTALANLGPEAEPALPALLKELDAWQPFRKDRQGAQALYRTAMALGSIGAPAVPALSNRLASDRWHVRAGAARALAFAGASARPVAPVLARALRDDRLEVREAAAETLIGFGSLSVDPMVDLLRTEEDPRTRIAAASTLGRLGTNAAPAEAPLNEVARDDRDAGVRAAALAAWCRVGVPAERSVPRLLSAWDDSAEPVRQSAFACLLLVRPVDKGLLPAILPRLDSVEPGEWARIARLLRELGPAAAAAASAVAGVLERETAAHGAATVGPGQRELVEALASLGEAALPPVFERLAAQPPGTLDTNDWAFATLRRASPLAVPVLIGAMSHASATVRAGALEALAELGDRARSAARSLPALLGDSDSAVRGRAWRAASRCGVSAETLLARQESGLADPSSEVRRAVILSLATLGAAAKPAVPRLVTLLESDDSALRSAVIRAFAILGPEAGAAVPALTGRLRQAAPDQQAELLRALAAVGPAAADSLPQWTNLVVSGEPAVRRAAFLTLAGLREGGLPARSLVGVGLRDTDSGVRAAAATALGAIDPGGEATVSELAAVLGDEASEPRAAAAEALGRLGERGRPAEERLFGMLENAGDRAVAREALRAIHPVSAPRLIEALGHADWTVRELGTEGLGRLGKAAREAIPALEKAVRDDPSEEVKRGARRALRRIREG